MLFQVERLAGQTTLELLREAAQLAADQIGEVGRPEGGKNWRRSRTVNMAELMLGVAEEVRTSMWRDTTQRWSEILALEQVWQELAAEFEGESLLASDVRTRTDETRRLLQEQLRRLGAPRLRGPDLKIAGYIRERVQLAFQHLRLVEV